MSIITKSSPVSRFAVSFTSWPLYSRLKNPRCLMNRRMRGKEKRVGDLLKRNTLCLCRESKRTSSVTRSVIWSLYERNYPNCVWIVTSTFRRNMPLPSSRANNSAQLLTHHDYPTTCCHNLRGQNPASEQKV